MPLRKPIETAAQVAKAILRLYRDDPTRWIKEEYAATSRRAKNVVPFDSRSARCWCVMGACYRVTKHDAKVWEEAPVIVDFRNQILDLTGQLVLDFNDDPDTRFRDVVAALRKIAEPKKGAVSRTSRRTHAVRS